MTNITIEDRRSSVYARFDLDWSADYDEQEQEEELSWWDVNEDIFMEEYFEGRCAE